MAVLGGINTTTDIVTTADLIPDGRSKNTFDTAFSLPGISFNGVSAVALGANFTYYSPCLVRTEITVDRIACEVTASAAAGKLLQLGIYDADVDWQPTTLVLDAGTVTADSNAVKTITISQVLVPGRYLLAVNGDGTPTLRNLRSMTGLWGIQSTIGASPWFSQAAASETIIGSGYAGTGTAWSNYAASNVGIQCWTFLRVSVP